MTTKTIDGITADGWFADDFTLREIKTLRAIQRLAFRGQQFNGFYEVPTFDEVLDLAKAARWTHGREVGVYPETKHPTYHQDVGLPLERRLVNALSRAGWNRASAQVFIQSFEVANLKELNRMTPVRLVQLIDANDVKLDGSIDSTGYGPYDFKATDDTRTYADLVTPAGLAEIATYADGLGPWKRYIIGAVASDADGDMVADDVNGDNRSRRRRSHRDAADLAAPRRPPGRTVRARLHLAQRAVVPARRLRRRPAAGIPALLLPGCGRRVLRQPRHGADGAGPLLGQSQSGLRALAPVSQARRRAHATVYAWARRECQRRT